MKLTLLLISVICFGCNHETKPVISFAVQYTYPLINSSTSEKPYIVRDTFYVQESLIGTTFTRCRWADTGHTGSWQKIAEDPSVLYTTGNNLNDYCISINGMWHYQVVQRNNDVLWINDQAMSSIKWRKI